MRALGVLLLLAAAALGLIGTAWTTFALVGTEWDYCPNGRDCIAGELVGLALLVVAGPAVWVGVRLVRAR